MRPLTGIRVVAFEQAVAMPYCSFVLAEMGADVIKIERPGRGDVIRGWDDAVDGLSTGFVWLNAGKRDVAVDARRPEGRDIVRRLVATADVFLENFAPGVVARLGLGDDDLRPGNPGLVYCSLSGYGQDGAYRDVKAYDLLVQGEAGIILTNGYPDAPAKVGLPIADLVGGSNAAVGVVAALHERQRTGLGRYLDVAMFDAAFLWLGYFPQHYWHGGGEPPRSGMRHQYLCPYGPFVAKDGRYVNLVVASDDDWRRFCERVVERPAWLTDPKLATIAARRDNRAEVDQLVEAAIAAAPAEEWFRRLAAAGLPYGEVRGIGDVVDHPQVAERGLVVPADSPVGPLPTVRFPLSDRDIRRRLPALGEHTEEALTEAGYSSDDVAELRDLGVV